MGEADPSEIVIIDKGTRSGERLRDIEGVQEAYDLVGSVQNITLTRLARNRRLLFVEDLNDFNLIRRFAKKLGLLELSAGTDLTPVESKGFSSWERINSFAWGIETALRDTLMIGAIFDRDYWSNEQIQEIAAQLNERIKFVHIHGRKEIENYLLVPQVIQRAIEKSLADKAQRSGQDAPETPSVEAILDKITMERKDTDQSQYIAKRCEFLRHKGKDAATITAETIKWF
jgi:hypothetical protein